METESYSINSACKSTKRLADFVLRFAFSVKLNFATLAKKKEDEDSNL